MRGIAILLLILLGMSYMAFVWETPEVRSVRDSASQVSWVRTRTGWEKRSDWEAPPPVYQPPIHPLALAGMQACLSLAALIAFPTVPPTLVEE